MMPASPAIFGKYLCPRIRRSFWERKAVINQNTWLLIRGIKEAQLQHVIHEHPTQAV